MRVSESDMGRMMGLLEGWDKNLYIDEACYYRTYHSGTEVPGNLYFIAVGIGSYFEENDFLPNGHNKYNKDAFKILDWTGIGFYNGFNHYEQNPIDKEKTGSLGMYWKIVASQTLALLYNFIEADGYGLEPESIWMCPQTYVQVMKHTNLKDRYHDLGVKPTLVFKEHNGEEEDKRELRYQRYIERIESFDLHEEDVDAISKSAKIKQAIGKNLRKLIVDDVQFPEHTLSCIKSGSVVELSRCKPIPTKVVLDFRLKNKFFEKHLIGTRELYLYNPNTFMD